MRAFLATLLLCLAPAANAHDIASVYGGRDGLCRRPTASGERLDCAALTAAMLQLGGRPVPLGSHVLVTNKANGRSIVVRINDRGPYVKGRVIDLTPAGARALGFSGLAHVTTEIQ